jgi:hypothetical protein
MICRVRRARLRTITNALDGKKPLPKSLPGAERNPWSEAEAGKKGRDFNHPPTPRQRGALFYHQGD